MIVQKVIKSCSKLGIVVEFRKRDSGWYYSIKNYEGSFIDSVANFGNATEAALYLSKLIGKYFE